MINWDISNTSLQTISFFLETAKYGSMTEAAIALNVTQPLISQRISSLESALGFPLFYRERRRLILSPGGRLLAERWSASIGSFDLAIQEATLAMSHASNKLVFGVFGGFNEPLVHKLARFLQKQFTDTAFSFRMYSLSELRSVYCSETVDIFLVPDYGTLSLDSSVRHVVYSSPFCAITSYEHPFVEKSSITVGDLDGESLLVLSSSYQYFYEQALLSLCKKNHFDPKIVYSVNEASLRLNVSLNRGISVINQFYIDDSLNDSLCSIPIENTNVDISVVWNKYAPSVVQKKGNDLLPALSSFFDKCGEKP